MPPADATELEAAIESAENNAVTDDTVAVDANDMTDENQQRIKAFPLVVDPAWDGAAFTSMMQTDLLTYSLSLSVAPLAKAIEAMGASLQKHDDTLLQLLQYCRHLETENQNLAQSAEASKQELLSHIGDVTQGVRDELLGHMQPLATKTEALTDDLTAAIATIADLAAQMHIKATEVTPSLPPIDPAMPQLERMKMIEDRLRECVTMHGLDQLRDDLSAMLPSTSGLASANELSALKDEVEASLQKQALALQEQLAALQTSIEDAGKAAKAQAPTPHLHELKRAQSYNTALKPSTLGSVTPPVSAAPPPPVDLTEVHQRLNQEEELLEALRQQYEALQEALQSHADDVAELKLQVAMTPTAELYAPRTMAPAMTTAPVTSDVVDNEMQLHRSLLDALGREMTDARTKHEHVVLQLRRLDPLEKQVRDLEAAQLMLQGDSDAHKAGAHALQTELRKVANDFRAFQDNQSLMQSFSAATTSGDGGADFSQVLGRLAEMRAAQDAAMDDVRSRMDTISDDNGVTQQWVHRLQNDAKYLLEKNEKHGAHIADWIERDDDDRQMALRHIETALLKEKEGLQRALQAQERLGIGFVDLHQHALALRKDLERLGAAEVLSVKLPEIQGLHTAFEHLLVQVPPLIAMPALLKDSLARLGNDIEAAHLPSDDTATLQDKVTSLLQLLNTLEQHNTDMTTQNELAKNNMDDLFQLWNSKMHVDMLQKYTQLVKELRDMARNGRSPSVHPSSASSPSRSGDGPVDAKMFDTKLIGTNRRLAEIEDTLRAMSRNLVSYRTDLSDKVTASNLAKLKFQVFSELAKIHAVLGSARFNSTGAGTTVVCDDADIKSNLDAQAELIASLCSDLKQSLSEKPSDDKTVLSRLGHDDDQFSSKLESITDKVAEMFVNLEANRNATQPRHAIPTYNPAQMLDSFAQNIEAKLAESQNLTKLQIESIKNELNDVIRFRVAKALESIRENLPIGEETTAGGSKPVICIACSRPVRVEPHVHETVHDRLPMEPILKVPHDPVLEALTDQMGDDYHVYRAGFRMPQHEKRAGPGKSVLPLLSSNPSSPTSPVKRVKKKTHEAAPS